MLFFFFKQKTAYEIGTGDWSSDVCSSDLTAIAREGKIDPIIGRDEEIRRVMQILSRRTKNNQIGRASCRERV